MKKKIIVVIMLMLFITSYFAGCTESVDGEEEPEEPEESEYYVIDRNYGDVEHKARVVSEKFVSTSQFPTFEIAINNVIQEEFAKGYKPISVASYGNTGWGHNICIILFEKLEEIRS